MKYIITENGFEKIMNSFFETEFEDCVLDVRKYGDEDWSGLWLPNGMLLVGGPHDNNNYWYFNGKYFEDQWKIFGINGNKFGEYMRDFLNEKYKGEIKIKKIV